MKKISKIILYFSLAAAALLFSLNNRFHVTVSGEGLLQTWTKYDSLTGRTWKATSVDNEIHWIEIRDYGYVFTKKDDEKG